MLNQTSHLAATLVVTFAGLSLALGAIAEPPESTSLAYGTNDIPKGFSATPARQSFSKRTEMVRMRDGVKLYTVIVVPNGARGAPIVLSRTPYNVEFYEEEPATDTLLQAGYIRVYQDTRGKYKSEGQYVVTWPPRGALNPSRVDHATDTWDTIEWLVKNVPESNGRVGMIGSSYEGFTTATALLDPHPAMRAAVPMGPVIDAWMGDDWFHYGAFRNMMLGYIHMQSAQQGPGTLTPSDTYDKYEEFLRAGSTGDYIRYWGLDRLPWIARTMAHPAYDDYWQEQALDKLLAARPSSVPTLWTQGLWDQEDMYGANHAWLALKASGYAANNWLVLGPWNHIQALTSGARLGPNAWKVDTTHEYERDILLPFLAEHLRGGPAANIARATVYNTGEKRWQHFDDWPVACRVGCAQGLTPLYLAPGFALTFSQPAEADAGDSYVSDPAKPVPFLPRPIVDPFALVSKGQLGAPYEPWSNWLVTDQRFVDGRPDVLTYETEVLTAPVRVRGVPLVDIRAITTGSDGDFVVKLIDVFPPKNPAAPETGGYQLPIAMDIFRGRYRESFSAPSAIPANEPQVYRFELPNVNHVFQPGHRMMIQVQSTLFPLYDRNPQTFVPNIFDAKPADYVKAEVTILRSSSHPSAVWLPVVESAN
jgi:putative CocE/NonD family hydrolase